MQLPSLLQARQLQAKRAAGLGSSTSLVEGDMKRTTEGPPRASRSFKKSKTKKASEYVYIALLAHTRCRRAAIPRSSNFLQIAGHGKLKPCEALKLVLGPLFRDISPRLEARSESIGS